VAPCDLRQGERREVDWPTEGDGGQIRWIEKNKKAAGRRLLACLAGYMPKRFVSTIIVGGVSGYCTDRGEEEKNLCPGSCTCHIVVSFLFFSERTSLVSCLVEDKCNGLIWTLVGRAYFLIPRVPYS
jgi:hypothetical protein